MISKDQLSQLESDARFQELKTKNPRAAADMARFVARKMVESGNATSRDPEITSFLQRNLPSVSGFKGAGVGAGAQIAKEAFKQGLGTTLTGSIGMKAAGVERAEPLDIFGAYQQLASGGYKPTAKEIALGLGSAAAATTGALADVPLGGAVSAKIAQQAARTLGRFAPAGIMAGEAAFGAAQGAGVPALAGATPEEIKSGAIIGGLTGGLASGIGAGLATKGMMPAQRPQTPQPPAAPRPQDWRAINLAAGAPGTQTLTGQQARRLNVPALPPPRMEAPAPMFSRQAVEGQVLPLDAVNQFYANAVKARIDADNALRALPQNANEEQLLAANQRLNRAIATENSARNLAEETRARLASGQERPIRVGPPQAPRQPLALPEPSGPPTLPARGMSEQALYGAPALPPAPPPIITPAPIARPQLPPPRGPEIIPPRPPSEILSEYVSQFEPALQGMAGRPSEAVYSPSTALVPVPRPVEAYPPGYLLGEQVGQRPGGTPLPSFMRLAIEPPPAEAVSPSLALVPVPRPIEAYPPGYLLGEQVGQRPGGTPLPSFMRPTLEQPSEMIPPSRQLAAPTGPEIAPRQLPPTMSKGQPAAVPTYVSQTPARGAEQALFGQPSSAIRAEVDAAARQRFALQKQLDELPALPEKPTKAQIKERTDTELQLRQAILSAGERQMSALQRLAEIEPMGGMPKQQVGAKVPRPPKITGKKKAPSEFSQTPLGRLISEEGGAVTPAGAVGALGAPIAAAAGAVFRGLRAGSAGLKTALSEMAQGPAFGALAEASSKVADVASNVTDRVAAAVPPQVAAAISAVRGAVPAAASNFDAVIAARYPTVAKALDEARRWTITNYGKPEAYLRMEEAAAAQGRRVQNDLANYGNRVLDSVGDDEARMARLYDDLTSETYVPGSNTVDDALVQEGRTLTGEVGRQLLNLRALTPEAFARWGGRYLPRTYEKILKKSAEDGITNRFARFIEDDPTLSGYYHRGTDEWVNNAQLERRLASGQGWQQIPAPVRYDKNGNRMYRIWRDWTQSERDSWGELKNVGIALEKYASAASREIKNGAFLEGVRTGSDANGAWALDAASVIGAGQRPKKFTDASGQNYIYLGDAARKDGVIKKYGSLSDHYVRDDIYTHVMTSAEFANFKQFARTAKKITGVNWWKKLVTIGNPSYFANNFFVNMPMLELAGGSIADLPMAARMIATGDPLIGELVSRGLIQDQMALRQLSSRVAPVLEAASGTPSGTATGFSEALSKASNALKRYENAAYNTANASDDLYRVALVRGLVERQRMSLDDAVNVANTAFYNRERVKAPIVDMFEPIIPFAAVTHWTLGSIPKLVYENPHKAAYLATVAAALPYVAEWYYGVGKEKAAAQRQLLPEQMRPGTVPALGFPNAIFAGYDNNGQPIYIDTSTWNPINALTAEVPVGPAGTLPRALSVGGPVAIAAQLYSNKDWYTGRPIVEYDPRGRRTAIDETLLSQIPGVGRVAPVEVRNFLYRSLVPGMIRAPYEAAKATAAQMVSPQTAANIGLTGGETVPVSLGTRAMRMVGIKARPVNINEMYARELGIEETSLSAVRKSQAAALRRYERAIQSGNEPEAQDALNKYTAYETMKQTIMMQEAERQQQLAPALSP